MIIILHNIRSIQNVGSIFRTADAAGIEKIYLCGITPTPFDRLKKKRQDFVKTSLGAEDFVAWEKVGSTLSPTPLITLIKKLKQEKYQIIALEQDKQSTPYHSYKPTNKTALIVGNEVEGIPSSILKCCDDIIEIPMRGRKESLNVSVAFGVAAYELAKHTQPTKLKTQTPNKKSL